MQAQKLKVVCLGGGNGLSALLSGLRNISIQSPLQIQNHLLTLNNITGIVTVSDDGGSSGRIRRQYPTPAPGDVRNCLLALASDQSLMSQLFSYRFSGSGELSDHSLGNLLLTALTDITGDFLQAVRLSSHILAVEGQILPSTNENVRLRAVMADGSEIHGETRIRDARTPIQQIFLEPADCPSLPESVHAISRADLIVLGPGSLFTSLIPNLLVRDIAGALEASKAVKLYVGNLMTEPGETDSFSASDHIDALSCNTGGRRLFSSALFNSAPVSNWMLERYAKENAEPVRIDHEKLKGLQLHVYEHPLLHEETKVRHDPVKLAEAILEIFDKEKGDG